MLIKMFCYDNRQHDMTGTWDFTLESSQQLKIVVKVPVSAQKAEFPNSGCVAIMFGFQEISKDLVRLQDWIKWQLCYMS